MRTTKSKKEKNWVVPGVKLTQDEFEKGIKKAEEGPFYTLDEIKSKMKVWKQSKNL
jgi:hypothetical protein